MTTHNDDTKPIILTATYYILSGDTPIPALRALDWASWFESCDPEVRKVAVDRVGDVHVSTCFIGVNYNFFQSGPPLLWETMVFGGEYNHDCERYASREEALAGHARMVEKCTKETSTG